MCGCCRDVPAIELEPVVEELEPELEIVAGRIWFDRVALEFGFDAGRIGG